MLPCPGCPPCLVVHVTASSSADPYSCTEICRTIEYVARTTKDGRLELRLTRQQKESIEEAAALSGRSVTDFSVPILVAEAAQVIQERDLAMSEEAWDAFQEILDRPAKRIDALADLLKRPSVFID